MSTSLGRRNLLKSSDSKIDEIACYERMLEIREFER